MSVISAFIKERRADQKLCDRLSRLAPQEQVVVEKIISSLNPSANTLKELLRLAEEIAARESSTLAEVLNAEEIEELLEHPSSKKDRQRLIRVELERWRFPQLGRLRDQLQDCQQQILSELGLRVELPQDLEGDTLSLTISAKNGRDFAVQGAKMTELSAHPALAKIFSLLKGDF